MKKELIVYIVCITLALLFVIIGTGYSVIVSQHQQSQWCDTLELLTKTPVSKPADPAANPSRVGEYQLYHDFVILERQFGCQT